MKVELESVARLRFADGSPVRAASAITRYGGGWLIAQDDATHACWLRDGVGTAVRVLPAVAGHDSFAESSGTKHLKPDLEAACEVSDRGAPAALLLGSGSAAARMRASLVRVRGDDPGHVSADLSPVYASVARVLGVDLDALNLEGACVLNGSLRWFHRGRPASGLPTCSVDLDLSALLGAVRGEADPADVTVTRKLVYDLGEVHGVGLGVTDAVLLGEHTVLVSAAAEDSPNPYDDGPVVGSALALLSPDRPPDVVLLPEVGGRTAKVEGLTVLEWDGSSGRLLATVDDDDAGAASALLTLRLRL